MENTQVTDRESTQAHQHWLSLRRALIANGAFAIYATVLAVDTGDADRIWAIWAAAGYGVTTIILWLIRHKNVPLIFPLLVSLAGALAAPVTWLASRWWRSCGDETRGRWSRCSRAFPLSNRLIRVRIRQRTAFLVRVRSAELIIYLNRKAPSPSTGNFHRHAVPRNSRSNAW